MMAIDSRQLNNKDEVLGDRSVEKALRQRAANRMQELYLAMASGAAGWEAGEPIRRRWFVLTVENRSEKDVEKSLSDAGIEAWLPMKKTEILVQGTRRIRNVERPVWLGYVFVSVVPCPEAFAGLAGVKGIRAILGTDIGPVAISAKEVNELMGLVKKGAFDEKRASQPFRPGSTVMIKSGPFAAFNAVLEGYVGTRAARVLVAIFGRVTPVELDLAQIGKSV